MNKKIIKLNAKDNVITALEDIDINDKIYLDGEEIVSLNKILFEHKMAIKNVKKGEIIIKYGVPIGIAYKDIKKGEHVHIHNLKTLQDDDLNILNKKEWKNRNV